MSPLVALLALACASLAVRPDMPCTTLTKGYVTADSIPLAQVYIETNDAGAKITMVDNCAINGKNLIGETLSVCDDVPPEVTMPPKRPFSPVVVRRIGDLQKQAPVQVYQYCDV